MRTFPITLAEALTSPLTSEADLERLAAEAEFVGQHEIAKATRAELDRRARLADAIEEGAAPCDGGVTPGGCH